MGGVTEHTHTKVLPIKPIKMLREEIEHILGRIYAN
jgi:hypothetical protein